MGYVIIIHTLPFLRETTVDLIFFFKLLTFLTDGDFLPAVLPLETVNDESDASCEDPNGAGSLEYEPVGLSADTRESDACNDKGKKNTQPQIKYMSCLILLCIADMIQVVI